jgi:hypothetical protein
MIALTYRKIGETKIEYADGIAGKSNVAKTQHHLSQEKREMSKAGQD